MGQRPSFRDLLTAANRILLELNAMDPKERPTLLSPVVRDCMRVYSELQAFQATAQLPDREGQFLQGVMDRMKTHLTSFGEDV